MVEWPASLPKCPVPTSEEESYERAIREFIPDTGDPIRRKSQSDSRKLFSGTYRMTRSQVMDFWTFYNTTINRGVDSFSMWDPESESYVTVKFASSEPPRSQRISRTYRVLQLAFRVIS